MQWRAVPPAWSPAAALTVVSAVVSAPVRADILPVEVHADDVTFDARARELEASGHVRVDSDPFHLSSDRLRIWRDSRGVRVRGKGRLAFCPCLGTPLTVAFDGATVAPPGDLLLENPRLELYRVPIAWLPFFWLRSPARAGVLPPDLAYRGADGFFVGEGVHFPWLWGDPRHGLDLRAGAYLLGGAAADVRLRTPASTTRVRVDALSGEAGLAVDARGALPTDASGTVAWDADVLRGPRAVTATTEVDAAARVYDRAAAEASWRTDGWTFASGARATSVRGSALGDAGAIGPVVAVGRADALGTLGTYDARVEGGALRDATVGTLSYGRGAGGVLLATTVGPVDGSLALRGVGDVGDAGFGGGYDGAASARAEARLPVGRSLSAPGSDDPWLHRIEPRLGVGALAARGDSVLGYLPNAGAVRGLAWLADAGVASSLGRWAERDGIDASIAAGAVGDDVQAEPVLRWRGAASGAFVGLGAEGAHALLTRGPALSGNAFAARARLGSMTGLYVAALAAAREGFDPVVARALTDAPLEPSSGFLATEGWTGGGRIGIPWGPYVTTQGGLDGDLGAREIVAARGSVEFRDKCGCLALRASAAERVGRRGVDVWVTIDLAPGL